MKKYSVMMVEHIKVILDSEGIASIIKNQYLSGALGEIPVTKC